MNPPRDDNLPPGFETHIEAGPERRPLFREAGEGEPFPLDALGALRPAAEAIHALTQAPSALCAQSVLAAASLAVCPHYDVTLPTGQRRPTALLCASVAASGERKTSVDRYATAAIIAYERELAKSDESARLRYWADKEAWKAATENAKKSAKNKGRAAIRDALEVIGAEPKPPPLPMLMISDPTPEGITLMLADGRPYAGLFTDEGGTLIGGHAFSDDSRMRTAGLLNSLWDGAPIRRLRVLTGNRFSPGRRLAGHVMMQAAVAEQLLGNAMLKDMGTLARLLVVAPNSTAGERLWREPDACARVAMNEYDARILALLHKPLRLADAGALDPRPLALSGDARRLLIAFHNAVESQLGSDGTLAQVRAFGAKAMEHAARLAAVLTAFADPEPDEIGVKAAESGCKLAHYYAAEILRLGDAAQIGDDLRLAEKLLEWWQRRADPRAHLAEIYQRAAFSIRTADRARQIVAILEEHGWVRRLPERVVLDGRPRRDAWVLT